MARKHLLSHLTHAEILTPKLEESVKFFKDLMGLEETSRSGQSVYMRCWDEYYHHSIVLTEAPLSALGHIGWRTGGPEELEMTVRQIEASGRVRDGARPQSGMGPPIVFAAQVGISTRSSGKSSVTQRHLSYSQRTRPGHSVSPVVASPHGRSTM